MIEKIKLILTEISKVSADILLILSVILVAWMTPVLQKQDAYGLFNVILLKLVCVSCGITHAHLSWKIRFRKVDLTNAMIKGQYGIVAFGLVWYSVIIYAWTRGG